MSFEFVFRRQLADLRCELEKAKIDMDEHISFATGTGKEVVRLLLVAKVNVAKHNVEELERRLETSLRLGRQVN